MSKRMNDFKQLMKIGDMTFADRVITNFQRAGIQDIAIVTGYRGEELEKSLKGSGVVFLRNDHYETTRMFDSACIGFSYLKDRCDAVFFCPVDVPFFTDETVKAEMNRAESADIIVPYCHARPGHPILLSQRAGAAAGDAPVTATTTARGWAPIRGRIIRICWIFIIHV